MSGTETLEETAGGDDYTAEVHEAMEKVIGRAWADDAFKAELLAKPEDAFGELGVHWPDKYEIQFYDDPSAKIGDWTSVGKGQTAVLRIPIPAAPGAGTVSDADLAAIGGAGAACCCCTGLCTCTGAVGQDTWY